MSLPEFHPGRGRASGHPGQVADQRYNIGASVLHAQTVITMLSFRPLSQLASHLDSERFSAAQQPLTGHRPGHQHLVGKPTGRGSSKPTRAHHRLDGSLQHLKPGVVTARRRQPRRGGWWCVHTPIQTPTTDKSSPKRVEARHLWRTTSHPDCGGEERPIQPSVAIVNLLPGERAGRAILADT
ncbi:MAG: hypothetical protein JWQ64_323 [Subtercola sp.]|nr:hypothetical protein [Subtercola sp.]